MTKLFQLTLFLEMKQTFSKCIGDLRFFNPDASYFTKLLRPISVID